jgi:hypothetical protein
LSQSIQLKADLILLAIFYFVHPPNNLSLKVGPVFFFGLGFISLP